jgi:hypothetical protein
LHPTHRGAERSPYRSGRSPDWLKMKNPNAPAVKRVAGSSVPKRPAESSTGSRAARRRGWPHHRRIGRSGNRAVRHRQASVRTEQAAWPQYAAKFIEKTRDLYPTMIYTSVSFVGSTALADELMLLGPRYANGVIVTQVVPAVDSYASAILKYKTALAKYFPGVLPDYVSLEGYVAGSLLLEGLKRAGRQLDTEKLVEALETVRDFDMGLGAPITLGPTEHQGSHKVWGTQLNENGRYQAIDLE